MQKVTLIPSCLADSQDVPVDLSVQSSVGTIAATEGYSRVRCSAAMIGLAISMSAVSCLLPKMSQPAMAEGAINSDFTETSLPSQKEADLNAPPTNESTAAKLTPPAIKHQVKQGESIWTLAAEYQVKPEAIAASNKIKPQGELLVGQTIKIPSNQISVKSTEINGVEQQERETSLENLRETRKRLQESLVALRSDESSLKSTPAKTQVIVTQVAQVNPNAQVGGDKQGNITALSVEQPNNQGIEIPVEMPPSESWSQSQGKPGQENKLNSLLPRSEESSAKVVNIQVQPPQPLPVRGQNPEPVSISKLEGDNFNTPIVLPVPTPENSGVSQEFQGIEQQQSKTVKVVSPIEVPQPRVVQPVSQTASRKTYNVRRGDTLNSIARNHGISVAELIRANGITNPNLIKLNQPLVIPGGSVAQKTQPNNIVISGLPINNNPNRSRLPEPRSPLFNNLPNDNQGQVEADLNQSTKGVSIPVEVATESHTNKLKADLNVIQQQYGNSESIPIAVEPPPANLGSIAQQPRNPEWDTPRRWQNKSSVPNRSLEGIGTQEQLVGVAPINVQEYNNSLRIPVGETVSPELPGLSDPGEYLPDAPVKFNGFIWPAKGVLTSGYGWRWGRMHKGLDIAAPVGTPIVAAASGEVISAGWNSGGYGNLVKLRHADGSVTYYAHNSRILVRQGQQVEQGQLIAQMGSTGYSTGPHLHFEIHPGGKGAVNPIAFLPKKRS